MKISVTQENLERALSHALKATALKSNVPVLANVLLSTGKGKLSIAATNLEIALTTWIGAEVVEDGELTVNAKLLAEFVSQLRPGVLELWREGQSFVVKSVDNIGKFVITAADDFPVLPELPAEADLEVKSLQFAEAVEKTYFAASTDQSRPTLTGLLLESKQRTASLVGLDGFRLAKKTLKLEKGLEEDLKLIIPARALSELSRIINDTAGKKDNLEIFWLRDKNQVGFRANEVCLISRILDGEFPNYQQIIPADHIVKVNFATAELSSTVKIVGIFARNLIGNKTLVKIEAETKRVLFSTNVAEVGANESGLDAVAVEGDDFETAFNARYLAEMLGVIAGDEVIFESNGVSAPGLFQDSADADYLHVIMPMRLE